MHSKMHLEEMHLSQMQFKMRLEEESHPNAFQNAFECHFDGVYLVPIIIKCVSNAFGDVNTPRTHCEMHLEYTRGGFIHPGGLQMHFEMHSRVVKCIYFKCISSNAFWNAFRMHLKKCILNKCILNAF